MYNLVPVGRFHVQVCGTTPCMLRGSDDDHRRLLQARHEAKGHTTEDGLWTFTEVECMGNCATAPMVQINDDNYEDLTPERLDAVLDALAARRDAEGQARRSPAATPASRSAGRPRSRKWSPRTTITGASGRERPDPDRARLLLIGWGSIRRSSTSSCSLPYWRHSAAPQSFGARRCARTRYDEHRHHRHRAGPGLHRLEDADRLAQDRRHPRRRRHRRLPTSQGALA